MITEISAPKLMVISDLHVGNPFSKAKARTIEFLYWAANNGYDICINGDGFEIAQTSFSKLAREVPEVFHALKSVTARGRNVYYIVGNHDILLENFLNDWGGFKVAPFLNVWSGEQRIRVEHGHLYDPFFVRQPVLYEFVTWFAGLFLKVSPGLYKAWIGFEKLKSKYLWRKVIGGKGIDGENAAFAIAAEELLNRGFDTVIFGHTHHAGEVDFGPGRRYFNSGSFMLGTAYIEISDGKVALKFWDERSNTKPNAIALPKIEKIAEAG